MIFLALLFGIVASVVIHEAAHALVAQSMGWEVIGLRITRRGPAVAVKAPEELQKALMSSLWLVALAGPMSNLILGEALLVTHVPVLVFLGYFNLIIAAFNLLPLPGSDGKHILQDLRGELE